MHSVCMLFFKQLPHLLHFLLIPLPAAACCSISRYTFLFNVSFMEDGLSCFRNGVSGSAGSMSAVAEVTVAALPVGVVVAGFGSCDEGTVGDCAMG